MTSELPQFVPYWGNEESDAVTEILSSSNYLNEYKTVRLFEKEFARSVGAKHCAAVTSGTSALYVAVHAALKTTDRPVTIPSHDGIFAHNALLAAGMIPSVTDVDETGLLDISKIQGESIVVHANGRIARDVGRIEDCAQSITHHTNGAISTYSFASTKHITTAGQGGAICCDSDEDFEQIVRFKDHGRADRQFLKPMSDNYDQWGFNFKMTEIQAAFGLVQLHDLPRRLRRLHEMYGIYYDMLNKSVKFDAAEPRWYVDMFTDRASHVIAHLKKNGIYCRSYPKPLHMQGVAQTNIDQGVFSNAEKRYACGIYLPSTTNLSDEDVTRVAQEVLVALE